VVRFKDVDVRNIVCLSGNVGCRIERTEQRVSSREVVGGEGVNALLMGVVGTKHPMVSECVLHTGGGVQGVRSLVVRVNDVTDPSGCGAGDATWITNCGTRRRRSVHGLKGGDPSILRKVIEVEAEARTKHSAAAATGRIGDSQARAESFSIVVGCAGDERNIESLQGQERRVFRLAAARSVKQAKGCVISKTVVEGELWSNAPRVFRVNAEALNVLGETTIARGSKDGTGCGIGGELRRVG